MNENISTKLMKKYGDADVIFVFGSQILGYAQPNSDIDVVVLYNDDSVIPHVELFDNFEIQVYNLNNFNLNNELQLMVFGYFPIYTVLDSDYFKKLREIAFVRVLKHSASHLAGEFGVNEIRVDLETLASLPWFEMIVTNPSQQTKFSRAKQKNIVESILLDVESRIISFLGDKKWYEFNGSENWGYLQKFGKLPQCYISKLLSVKGCVKTGGGNPLNHALRVLRVPLNVFSVQKRISSITKTGYSDEGILHVHRSIRDF